MVFDALLQPQAVPAALAVTGMLLLAALLLRYHFNNPVNRVFALFLVLRAVSYALATARELLVDARDLGTAVMMARLYPYFVLPLPLVLLAFVALYPRRRTWLGRSPAALWLLLGLGAALDLAYLADHRLVDTVVNLGTPFSFVVFQGPLLPLLSAVNIAMAAVSLVLALDYVRAEGGRRRQSLALVWLGFTVNALFELSASVLVVAQVLPTGGQVPLLTWMQLPGIPLVVAAVAVMASRARTDAAARATMRRFAPALALAVASSLSAPFDPVYFAFFGLWRFALPALATYALLRYQLFDVELKVRWTIKQSTVAAAFIGIFFMVSELAANVFSQSVGPVLGIVAAGVLVFAIAPIQHAAERVAHAAMPLARPMAALDMEERADIYLEQVRAAWQDGSLTRAERRVLDVARERLGLSLEEASRLERQVVAEPG